MKTYFIASDTNYDLYAHIVNAETEEEAREIAMKNGAWDGCEITELDTQTPGLVFGRGA